MKTNIILNQQQLVIKVPNRNHNRIVAIPISPAKNFKAESRQSNTSNNTTQNSNPHNNQPDTLNYTNLISPPLVTNIPLHRTILSPKFLARVILHLIRRRIHTTTTTSRTSAKVPAAALGHWLATTLGHLLLPTSRGGTRSNMASRFMRLIFLGRGAEVFIESLFLAEGRTIVEAELAWLMLGVVFFC
jgi:hypothetical protein